MFGSFIIRTRDKWAYVENEFVAPSWEKSVGIDSNRFEKSKKTIIRSMSGMKCSYAIISFELA